MGWDDYNRRRVAIKRVLEYAEKNPAAGLPYEQVAESFRDRRELLLALQYDWSQALWARIELLSVDARLADAGKLAHAAWSQCAARNPVLRRLLDEHRDELGPATERERHLMTVA